MADISTIHVNDTDYNIKDATARSGLAGKEDASNKTTSVRPVSSASDTLYPSEKAVASAISSSTGAEWGAITGTLSSQTDLQGALDAKLDTSLKGANSGLAELDASGKVPSSQLPAYVDDVVEVDDYASLPATGETGKIYVTKDTNKTYRWTGTAYVEISASLALGETSSTAYRGDRGKTAYDHSQTTGNPHGTTASEITGLGDLAVKDSASGAFTPSGSITVTPATDSVQGITGVGTLPTHAADTFTQGTLPSHGNDTFTQGSLPTFSADVTAEVLTFTFTQGTLPTFTQGTFSKGTLPTFTQGTFTQGTLPTQGTSKTFMTGASASFSGTEGTVTVS